MKLRNKKLSTLLFSALIVLVFFGCQSMDEAMMSQTDEFKYGTKEFNQQSHDYGARNYDGARLRYSTPDPVAETYPQVSPYAYTAKNPIYVDLQGDSINISVPAKTEVEE